ncbi:MAG: DUF4249 domain-containing protein [Saprospiraceae bacterium]|nr:DUF4249 domain-containing protein [Saprospiraceae bacterium]
MRKVRNVLICLVLVSQGCIDTLDIELPIEDQNRLVVEGFVERGKDVYVFFVTVSGTQATSETPLRNLQEAQIEIIVDGSPSITLVNAEPRSMGIDEFHQSYGGDAETAVFRLRVQARGQTYESQDQSIIESPPVGSLSMTTTTRSELNSVENIVENSFVELRIDAPVLNDQNQRVSMRWDVSAVYEYAEVAWTDNPFFQTKSCYVDDRPRNSNFSLVLASEVRGEEVRGLMIDEINLGGKFNRGYYYTVLQRTLTDQAADYWNQIALSGTREGSIFDVPAGRLASNINNISQPDESVLGYFYGSAVDTLRLLVRAADVNYPRGPCPLDGAIDETNPCCDCLRLQNSTTERPHYWR